MLTCQVLLKVKHIDSKRESIQCNSKVFNRIYQYHYKKTNKNYNNTPSPGHILHLS